MYIVLLNFNFKYLICCIVEDLQNRHLSGEGFPFPGREVLIMGYLDPFYIQIE